jgi:Mn2+/Fe2+ NRAMP family transporter
LPFALALILFAATKKSIMKKYKHPLWMQIAGWLVVVVMIVMSVLAILNF